MNRRRLLRGMLGGVALALVSMAVTYGVAWGAMYANYKRWFIAAPGGGGPGRTWWVGRSPGDLVRLHRARDFITGEAPANFTGDSQNSPGSQWSEESGFAQKGPDACRLQTAAAGWPWPALLGEARRVSSRRWDEAAGAWLEVDVREGTWWALVLPGGGGAAAGPGPSPNPRLLPLRPLWPGFILNTLGAAGVLGAPVGAVIAVRGWRARRRAGRIAAGCCAACGYRLNGLPVCPECGAVG